MTLRTVAALMSRSNDDPGTDRFGGRDVNVNDSL